jgi:hypothetical protein
LTIELVDLSAIPGLTLSEPTTAANKFSTLIYGRMKSGKSWLAASCADVIQMSPVLWIAAEDGTASFGDTYGDKIDVVHPTTADQIHKLIKKLTQVDTEGNLKFPTKYKTIVVDTVGAYQNKVKRDYIEKNKDGDFTMWGLIGSQITEITEMVHRSPYNLILLAHHEKVKDETEGKLLIMPHMLGKTAIVDIPPIVDNVFFLKKVEDGDKGTVRVLQTQGTDRIDAGGRFEGKIPKQMNNPTFQEIYNFITA